MRMLQKGRIRIFLLFCLLLTIDTSCKPAHLSDRKAAGDTLIVPDIEKLALINPLLTSTTLSTRVNEILFDGLIRVDDRFEPKPHLAQAWETSADGRVWTFHIRTGIKFHDGVELTAEDVAFTFMKVKELENQTPFGFIFQDVDTISVKDNYTVQIVLKKPLASFLQTLFMGILPKHLLEGQDLTNTPFNKNPIGTGPFKFKSWSEKEILLEANPAYFLNRPYLNQIRVRVYPNREAAWAKLMAGEVDFFDFLTPGNYEILKQVPAFNFYSVPMPFYYLVAFNLESQLFKDQKVRQALNYSVNKQEIITKVLLGQGQAASGTIYPGSWAYDPNVRPYPYDPKRALALLKEAGWDDYDGDHILDKDGKPFEFAVHVIAGDDLKQKTLLLIQQQLLDIGIRMNIVLFNAEDSRFLFEKKFQAHFPEIGARGDPEFNYRLWHSSQINGGFNVSSYRNDKVDRLLEDGKTEFDQGKRKAIYYNFQEEMLKDPPGIFLFWTNYLVGVQKRFKGVKISPVGPFANIQEWYVPKAEQRYTESQDLSNAKGK